jgi:hypothetical protein
MTTPEVSPEYQELTPVETPAETPVLPVQKKQSGLKIALVILIILLLSAIAFIIVLIQNYFSVVNGNVVNTTNTPTPSVTDTLKPTTTLTVAPTLTTTATYQGECIFGNNGGIGYGINDITVDDKIMLCSYFKSVAGESTGWREIQIVGKEFPYIDAGNDIPCLLKVTDGVVSKVFCQGDIIACSSVDGLGVTNLISSCWDATLPGEVIRATK